MELSLPPGKLVRRPQLNARATEDSTAWRNPPSRGPDGCPRPHPSGFKEERPQTRLTVFHALALQTHCGEEAGEPEAK